MSGAAAPTPVWRLAGRLLWRDLAAGRLVVMLIAATLAVACTVSVSLLVSRVGQVIVAESSALLAGDLAIASNDPPPERYARYAETVDLSVSHTATMRSVITFGEELQLVQLKAVDGAYPLRGRLLVSARLDAPAEEVRSGPAPGEVWADTKLFRLLGASVGDRVGIGGRSFVLGRVLLLEPDRGGDLFAIAPRVLMHRDDLGSTGLVVEGSRVSYTLLLAGAPQAVDRFRNTFDPDEGHDVADPRGARPEMRSAFTQAERFLALAAFAGVMLATIGIALAAFSYGEHHEMTTAIARTLGLTRGEISRLFLAELVYLALLATLAGGLLAFLVHDVLVGYFLPAAAAAVSTVPAAPFLHGGAVALVALVGFGLPSLARLSRQPVVAILARDRSGTRTMPVRAALAMIAATLLIAPWHVGNARLVGIALAGMAASAAVLALASFLLVRLLGGLRGRTSMSWRFGLANVARRARLSVLQCTAVGLGITVILLLGLVRGDLVRQWSDRLPPDAPNHFLINVQGDEREAMLEFLVAEGVGATRFYPMVRGRLTGIGERIITPEVYAEPRARRLADREFNLSWASAPKPDNRIVAGRWWDADTATAEMSVEEGIARTLGIELGDELTFSVAGTPVRGLVTSLRAVQWDNFEVNFFVVTTPPLLADAPATWITAFRLPAGREGVMGELVRRHPSVTVIDVDALMRQVRSVMDRVSQALMWVFGFSLAAGLLVLAAAVQASQRERALDAVLLKTIGASSRFVRSTMLLEFAVLGALAGIIASGGAVATGWVLAQTVLEIPYRPWLGIPLVGVLGGVAGVTLVGTGVLSRVLRVPVTHGLREQL